MHEKVVVITGASGALGKVVADTAIARGARVAGIDYANAKSGTTADRIELGGVDLSDPAQALQAVDAAAAHFGRLEVLVNIAGAFAFETIADGNSKTWQHLYAINVTTALNASRAAIPHLVIRRRTYRQHRRDRSITGRRWHGRLCCVESGRASADRSACLRVERQGDRQCRPALDDRHASQPQGHAQSGFRDVGDGPRTSECHSVSGQRCGKQRSPGRCYPCAGVFEVCNYCLEANDLRVYSDRATVLRDEVT